MTQEKVKVTFNVITPMNRPENIFSMAELLKNRRKNQNVQWHVITDETSTKTFEFPNYDWVHHYKCPEHPNNLTNFWDRCNWAMNWFLDTHNIVDEDLYCFLNDDDGVEPDYFDKIYAALEEHKWEYKVVIPSMERGHRIPSYAREPRRHPPDKLWAAPENIKIGGVGLEQIVASGSVVKTQRFPFHVCGDGIFIIEAVRAHGAIICPGASVWFNYFEPERWDRSDSLI